MKLKSQCHRVWNKGLKYAIKKKQYTYMHPELYNIYCRRVWILCSNVDKYITPDEKENFHAFFRSSTNTTQSIYGTEDNTFNSLKTLRNNDIVLLSEDKDSSTIDLDKNTYYVKTNDIVKKE